MRVFVGTQVHRSDDDRSGLEGLNRLCVGIVMLLFGRLGGTVQVEKLGSIESNPITALLQYHLTLIGEFDVSQQHDPGPVPRFGRLLSQSVEFLLEDRELPQRFTVLLEGPFIGINDHKTTMAVHNDRIPGSNRLRKILEGHDGRDGQGAGHNRGMAGSPARIGGNAANVVAVKSCRLRRTQFPRDNDHFLAQMIDIFALVAQQVPQQSPLDVIDVGGPLADVGIFHVREMCGKLAKHAGHGKFGSHQL